MYNIHQFRPTLYLLLLMGLVGFLVGSESVPVALLGIAAVIWVWMRESSEKFRPLSRWLSNLLGLLAVLFAAIQIKNQVTPLLAFGQLLVLTQVVILFGKRTNRDNAWLLVVSLLTMAAAAISTASLLFGIILIVYLFLALYCCLLFHLKVESENAKSAFAIPEDKINPTTLKQDQRYLPRSMRRLSSLIAFTSITAAVLVFIFFPRGGVGGITGRWQTTRTMSGFNEQANLQQFGRISQNQEIVGYVKLWKDDKIVDGGQVLMLRGVTHDIYNGPQSKFAGAWDWSSSPKPLQVRPISAKSERHFSQATAGQGTKWRQHITLLPNRNSIIFAMPGIISLLPMRDLRVAWYVTDHTMRSLDPVILQPLEYDVVSNEILPAEENHLAYPQSTTRPDNGHDDRSYIDPKIRQYALRRELTDGLAARRPASNTAQPMDGEIARRIEKYLQDNFTYTLDTTDYRRSGDQDPAVTFLYDQKKGYCFHFASAMTLLCQSLHMQSRLVLGFKCDEYNEIGGYFIVRQSHAHAWVEVLTPEGWKTFDPTTGRDAPNAYHASLWQQIKHLFNYLDFTWSSAVIAYNEEKQTNIVQGTQNQIVSLASPWNRFTRRCFIWWNSFTLGWLTALLSLVIGLLVAIMIILIAWYAAARWRMRRRARRIGIEQLSAPDQQRLVRQLLFYAELMRVLERHQIVRPRHQTPQEFTNTLSFLPSDIYDSIRRLTGMFYRIRYGGKELGSAQQHRLMGIIHQIERTLGMAGEVNP